MAEKKFRSTKKKKPKNHDGTMALREHLIELRRRIMISLAALLVGTIIGFIWYQNAPFGIFSLGEIIRRPYCNLPEDLRVSFNDGEECRLLATSPFEMFMLRLKVGALAGLVLSSPVWLTQIWLFIVPGLHKKEKRYTFTFVTLAVILFVLGALLAYFILDVGLAVLLSIGDEFQQAWLTGQQYYDFVLGLTVIFGVSFEIPLIVILLNIMGVLEYEHVKDKRRIVIVVVFIFAAFMTPGQDPISMIVLATAVSFLVELSFQFCRVNDKRKARKRPEWMDLDDDETSELNHIPAPVSKPAPVSSSRTPAPSSEPTPSPQPTAPRAADNAASTRDNTETSYFDDVL
ncbi:Sec-independent protein translocase protein TatC [Corynebacterium cystitidis DSM 20524]|uniref:Sec-independent protein translocase protein TatC n=2 Tax=Corynebacterium cystitidis TaxID=35757 RepID=A0A1H9PQ55_9CORY|nr:Sec-independent protein translocase protein TatC [Corynebacterium cystitidis DSM 20524]SER50362.1 sec-independent protein translocase protein TatC [Corynebacterium cystitidis DSM 20524]SNV75807.1 Sec-independent protein translocase protein tatC [Corynebacterium cystitidis]